MNREVNIQEIVAAAYDEIKLWQPTVELCITPLDKLLRGYELTRTEISGLTTKSVASLLTRRSSIEPAIDLNDERLAGFLYVSPRFGSVFVEQSDPVARRRFSAAHELGHYLLHFRPLLAELGKDGEPLLIEATDAFPTATEETEIDSLPESKIVVNEESKEFLPPIEEMELQANEFAAELLMPESVVRALVSRHGEDLQDEALIWRMATDMLVSAAAMRWRLRSLRLIRAEKTMAN